MLSWRCVGWLSLVMLFTIILSTIPMVDGIKCYQCNSNNNSACTNLERYVHRKFIGVTECPENGEQPAFCRMMYTSFADNEKNWAERVVRDCGYLKYKSPCYHSVNDDHYEKVCQCFEDGCNTATSIAPYLVTLFILPALLVAKMM